MIDHDIRIVEDDDRVWVDGVSQRVLLLERMSERTNYISWSKADQEGVIQLRNGEEYTFTDESLVQTLLDKWTAENNRGESDTEGRFNSRNSKNAFDVSALLKSGRDAKQAIIDAKVAAEQASREAWQTSLQAKRADRRQALAAKNAARKAAIRERGQAAREAGS